MWRSTRAVCSETPSATSVPSAGSMPSWPETHTTSPSPGAAAAAWLYGAPCTGAGAASVRIVLTPSTLLPHRDAGLVHRRLHLRDRVDAVVEDGGGQHGVGAPAHDRL